jgi:hypothetical protein
VFTARYEFNLEVQFNLTLFLRVKIRWKKRNIFKPGSNKKCFLLRRIEFRRICRYIFLNIYRSEKCFIHCYGKIYSTYMIVQFLL